MNIEIKCYFENEMHFCHIFWPSSGKGFEYNSQEIVYSCFSFHFPFSKTITIASFKKESDCKSRPEILLFAEVASGMKLLFTIGETSQYFHSSFLLVGNPSLLKASIACFRIDEKVCPFNSEKELTLTHTYLQD